MKFVNAFDTSLILTMVGSVSDQSVAPSCDVFASRVLDGLIRDEFVIGFLQYRLRA